MGISKTFGSGLVAAFAVVSLSTGAGAQALPEFVGPGDTFTVTTPILRSIHNFGGTIDIQAPGGDLTLGGGSNNGGLLVNSGTLGIAAGGTLDNGDTITSSGTIINSGTLNNNGGATLTSSGSFTNYDSVYNYAGGTLTNSGTFTNNGSIINNIGATLINEGTLTGDSLYNNGVLTNTGTLISTGFSSNSGTVSNSGNIDIAAGANIFGFGAASISQTAGALTVNGQLQQASIAIGGGTLGGSGFITADVTVNGGTVGPGNSPGLLTVFGDVALLAGSTFAAELGGLAAGTGYDRLDVFNGTATLDAGTMFDIDFFGAFTAGLGETFDVLVADDIQSAPMSAMLFDFTGAGLGSGLAWEFGIVDFGNGRDALRLSVVEGQVAAVPAPGAMLLLGLGLFGIGCARRFA